MKHKGMLYSQMLAMMALASMPDMSLDKKGTRFIVEDIPVKKIIPKGCKEFYFDDFTCIALNQQSALKKYKAHLKNKK